jgi:hypothetical protein
MSVPEEIWTVERGNAHRHGDAVIPGPVEGCMWCEQEPPRPITNTQLSDMAAQRLTLPQILFRHRALTGAKALEIVELTVEIKAWHNERTAANLAAVVADARRLRDEAKQSSHVGWSDDYDPDRKSATLAGDRWDDANPGLAALLREVDDE